jgi:hypothetical protein
MKDLATLKGMVISILEQDEKSRNSDSYLYFRLIGLLGEQKGIDMNFIPVSAFLLNMAEWGFPPFESVRRTRQKVQHDCPWLSACEKVKGFRAENEQVYRDFARE